MAFVIGLLDITRCRNYIKSGCEYSIISLTILGIE